MTLIEAVGTVLEDLRKMKIKIFFRNQFINDFLGNKYFLYLKLKKN